MQDALDEAGHDVAIIGVNAVGESKGNPAMVRGHDLPWLQDTPEQKVWTRWDIEWRDVVVLDAEGEVAGVLNLTEHDLGQAAHRQKLTTLLVGESDDS